MSKMSKADKKGKPDKSLPYSTQSISEADIEAVSSALASPLLTQGSELARFTSLLSSYTNAKYALCYNSATSALFSAYSTLLAPLVSLGRRLDGTLLNKYNAILRGDFHLKNDPALDLDLQGSSNPSLTSDEINLLFPIEVITTPISFVATTNMLLPLHICPIFAPVLANGNINADKIEALITEKTRAIVSVDFAGTPVEYEKIRAICKRHNLIFISDASHALGAGVKIDPKTKLDLDLKSQTFERKMDPNPETLKLNSHSNPKKPESNLNKMQKVGSLADATIFSFHPVKPITTGEGGAITLDDEAVFKRLSYHSSHGVEKKRPYLYDVTSLGYNFRVNEMQAALGISQLGRLDAFIKVRHKNHAYYKEALKNCKNLYLLDLPANSYTSLHLSIIVIASSLWCAKEGIIEALHAKGVMVQLHYRPIYAFSLYKRLFASTISKETRQSADMFYNSMLSIPNHQGMSEDELAYVVRALCEVIG